MSLVAEAGFGLALLREASVNQTAVLSPISLALALSLVHLGSDGNAKEQIKHFLCKDASHYNCSSYFSVVQKSLSMKDHPYLKNWMYCRKPGNLSCVPEHDRKYFKAEEVEADFPLQNTPVLVNVANRVYVSANVKVKKEYSDGIASKFDAVTRRIDYSNEEKAAKIVNNYVKMETAGKISKLLDAENELVLLINAVYFHGIWAKTFSETWNGRGKFYQNETNSKQVTFMKHTEERFPLTVTQDFVALGLPFKDNQYRMTIILPKKRYGIAEVREKLNGVQLQKVVTNNNIKTVNVALPKFKTETELKLHNVLQNIGMTDLFTTNLEIADSPLKLGKVMHKVTIDVNEKGTTAAASSAIELIDYIAEIDTEKPIDFIADHPFLYVLSKEGHILFIGQYYG